MVKSVLFKMCQLFKSACFCIFYFIQCVFAAVLIEVFSCKIYVGTLFSWRPQKTSKKISKRQEKSFVTTNAFNCFRNFEFTWIVVPVFCYFKCVLFLFQICRRKSQTAKGSLKVIFTLMKREKYCSTFGHAGTLDILLW